MVGHGHWLRGVVPGRVLVARAMRSFMTCRCAAPVRPRGGAGRAGGWGLAGRWSSRSAGLGQRRAAPARARNARCRRVASGSWVGE